MMPAVFYFPTLAIPAPVFVKGDTVKVTIKRYHQNTD